MSVFLCENFDYSNHNIPRYIVSVFYSIASPFSPSPRKTRLNYFTFLDNDNGIRKYPQNVTFVN